MQHSVVVPVFDLKVNGHVFQHQQIFQALTVLRSKVDTSPSCSSKGPEVGISNLSANACTVVYLHARKGREGAGVLGQDGCRLLCPKLAWDKANDSAPGMQVKNPAKMYMGQRICYSFFK